MMRLIASLPLHASCPMMVNALITAFDNFFESSRIKVGRQFDSKIIGNVRMSSEATDSTTLRLSWRRFTLELLMKEQQIGMALWRSLLNESLFAMPTRMKTAF